MGFLNLICVTTDPEAIIFYGLAYAANYSTNDAESKYVVLIRSNTKPTSPTDLTWPVVSIFDGSKLAGYPYIIDGSDYTCTSNAQGVFTMLGRATSDSSALKDKQPYGIRYDPSGKMDDSFKYNRPGAWMNITVDGQYNWSEGVNRHSLGYINTSTNRVLVHASISSTNNTINLATLDESTNTLSYTALWSMNVTIHGSPLQAVTIGNDHLYVFVKGEYLRKNSYLTGFPLNTTISPSTPVSKSFNMTQRNSCYNSPTPLVYFLNDSLTLLCGQKRTSAGKWSVFTPNIFLTIKEPNNTNALDTGSWVEFEADIINMNFFVPIGPGTGESTFALLKKEGTMYAFGNDGGFQYTHMIDKVNVTDSYGINPNPSAPPAAIPESSALSAGAIVGIVAGALVFAACTFLLGRMTSGKNRSKKRDDDEATGSTAEKAQPNQPLDNSKDPPQEQGQKDGANYFEYEGKYLIPTYRPERQTRSSTEFLPMAPIDPVPQDIQDQFRALQDQLRILQSQLQASQFSSHPRPNVVTSTSYIGEPPTPNNVSEQYAEVATEKLTTTSSAFWQSIPFVPPTCPVNSAGMPSPNAAAYSSIVNQSPPQGSASVAPHETSDLGERSSSIPALASSTLDST